MFTLQCSLILTVSPIQLGKYLSCVIAVSLDADLSLGRGLNFLHVLERFGEKYVLPRLVMGLDAGVPGNKVSSIEF